VDEISNLTTLNQIAESLNKAVDVRSVLSTALAELVELMRLESGWVFLRDPAARGSWHGPGFVLAAHYNLPPALDLLQSEAWEGPCDCQGLCSAAKQDTAYNQVQCSRLAAATGERRRLKVHASTVLRSGDSTLGILNVAGPSWDAFSLEALALLTNAGNQMGAALGRAQLYDQLQEQRLDEQSALLELSNQALRRLDRDDLLAYLVHETARLLQADACALLLPGDREDCLDFAATTGWQRDPVAQGRCVPGEEDSGPGWVMRTQRPLLVEDIQKHDPVPWLPDWLRGEGFQGHALVPLLAGDQALGVLALDYRQPRLLNEGEARFLRLIANQAAIAIEQVRLHKEALQRQQMEAELAMGRQIQLSLLPRSCPTPPGWESAAIYQPARQVGGDFYDFIDLQVDTRYPHPVGDSGIPEPGPDSGQPRRLGVVIADVTDKGVPAALFMALSRTMVRTTALSGRRPAAALARANDLIRKDSRSDLFVSTFYGILEPDTGRLVYANAGHTPPLWLQKATGRVFELEGRGIVLGILPGARGEEHEIVLAPGDLLVLYTDGVTEATDSQGRMFGEERLHDMVAGLGSATAQEVIAAILDAVRSFAGGAPQADDLTLVVLRRLPSESQ
jgi:sigma-B regulation protein RsbU (phosphoserine phosphatase)